MVDDSKLATSPTHAHDDIVYGTPYLEWKGWREENFANVGELETAYFNAEIKKISDFSIRNNINVLEIGFGNGSFLAYAKNKGWAIMGTEVNNALVQIATRRGFTAVHADDLNTLSKESFDLVAAFDVLEHIPQDHLLSFVDHLIKLLKPGGFLFARFPNADSPFGLMNQNGDVTHTNAIGRGKLIYLARELGLELVSFCGQAIPVYGNTTRVIRRFCGLALFKVVDTVVNRIFFPNDPISFCSSNVVVIFRVPSQTSTINDKSLNRDVSNNKPFTK